MITLTKKQWLKIWERIIINASWGEKNQWENEGDNFTVDLESVWTKLEQDLEGRQDLSGPIYDQNLEVLRICVLSQCEGKKSD